jgi:hypothetical protein
MRLPNFTADVCLVGTGNTNLSSSGRPTTNMGNGEVLVQFPYPCRTPRCICDQNDGEWVCYVQNGVYRCHCIYF